MGGLIVVVPAIGIYTLKTALLFEKSKQLTMRHLRKAFLTSTHVAARRAPAIQR
jgi:hypothetical protein